MYGVVRRDARVWREDGSERWGINGSDGCKMGLSEESCNLTSRFMYSKTFLYPRSHCADLAVPISTIWKIVDIGMVGSWSRGNIVLTSWKSARSGNDRQWSGSQCWSWLWLRSIHGSISVVCGIGNVVRLSYPAWGHSWTACGHSWTAYGWSWRPDQCNYRNLSNWCDFYVFIYSKICIYIYIYICIYVYLLITWVYSWVEGDST